MVQGDLQQDHLHRNHDERLDEERLVEFRTGVVEDPDAHALAGVKEAQGPDPTAVDLPKQRGDEHNKRDVQGEAGAGPRAVHGQGLVAVREQRREDQECRGKIPRQRR